MELNRASEVSAADWLSQTHVENYRNFLGEAIQFLSEVEIPIKGLGRRQLSMRNLGAKFNFSVGHGKFNFSPLYAEIASSGRIPVVLTPSRQ